jgi:hypothetical protein
MFGELHQKAIIRAAAEPEMQTTHKGALFKRLLLGGETLSAQDIRELRHSARYPGFVPSLQRVLTEVADVHEAAQALNKNRYPDFPRRAEAAQALNKKSPAQIDHEIEIVVGKPPPKSKKRR